MADLAVMNSWRLSTHHGDAGMCECQPIMTGLMHPKVQKSNKRQIADALLADASANTVDDSKQCAGTSWIECIQRVLVYPTLVGRRSSTWHPAIHLHGMPVFSNHLGCPASANMNHIKLRLCHFSGDGRTPRILGCVLEPRIGHGAWDRAWSMGNENWLLQSLGMKKT